MKRKISIVVDNRTNWTKAQTICEGVETSSELELQLILTSSFEKEKEYDLEFLDRWMPKRIRISTDSRTMVDVSSDLMIDLGEFWEDHRPDVVIALTDRFETLAVAQTAALMNIHIAHVQGGEVTGTIDESIRHTITKLSHIHFVSNQDAKNRVIRLGEDPLFVFDTGCPSIDLLLIREDLESESPIAKPPYILVLYHPVTTEPGLNKLHMLSLLTAVSEFKGHNRVIFAPNNDLGSDEIWEAIKEKQLLGSLWESKPPNDFHNLIYYSSVMVGNSSAGIREAGYFGTPVVDCGSRQQYRIRGKNVVTIFDLTKPNGVRQAIEAQLEHGRFEPQKLFGDGHSGERIVKLLEEMKLPPIQKRIRF